MPSLWLICVRVWIFFITLMRSCWFFVNYFADCSFRIKWWAIQIVQARLWTRAARQGWVSWRCVAWWCVKTSLSHVTAPSLSFFFSLSLNRSELDVTITKCERIYHYDMIFLLNHDCVSKLGKVLQSEWDKRGGRGGRRRALYPLSPCTRYLSTFGCGPLDNKQFRVNWLDLVDNPTYVHMSRVNKAKNK